MSLCGDDYGPDTDAPCEDDYETFELDQLAQDDEGDECPPGLCTECWYRGEREDEDEEGDGLCPFHYDEALQRQADRAAEDV